MNEYMRNRRSDEGTEGFFCRFTFGQFFAILVLEVFTLFFVFYLGARYGREFLGLDKEPRVAAEGEASGTQEGISIEPQVLTTSDPEASKMAKELIEKAQTPELKDRISKMFEAAGGQAKMPEVVGRNLAASEPNIPANEQNTVTNNQVIISGGEEKASVPEAMPIPQEASHGRPTEEVPPIAKSQTKPSSETGVADEAKQQPSDTSVIRIKSAENGKYALQVGSYPQLAEATKIVDRWKGKGYPAYMMIADIPDRGRWYRVRIGGFSSREDASSYLKEFQTHENIEALIVMNEQ